MSHPELRKKALVIAVSEYDENSSLKDLPFCKNDGGGMLTLLQDLKYEIKNTDGLIGHVDGRLMQDSIYNFFKDDDIKSDDTILFYFSGHGVPGDDDFFLAASNIDPKRPKMRGFSFADLNGEISHCRARRVIVILDSCYAGSLDISGKSNESAVAAAAKNHMSSTFKQGEGRCLLASSMGFQESYATAKGEYSFFTNYLLKGLRGANGRSVDDVGVVTPESLMSYVDREIDVLENRPTQTPFRKIESAGKLILASYPQYIRKVISRGKSTNLPDILEEANKYLSLEMYDKAREYFDKVLEINPKDVSAWLGRAKIFSETMLYEKALKCYEKVIDLDPSQPNVWFYKGNLHFKEGKYEQALICFAKATEADPADPDAWYNKGCTLKKLSRKNEAKFCLDKFNELKRGPVEGALADIKSAGLEHTRFGIFRRAKTKPLEIIDKKSEQVNASLIKTKPEKAMPKAESIQKAKRFGLFRRSNDKYSIKTKNEKRNYYTGKVNQFYLSSDWEHSRMHMYGVKPIFIYTMLLENFEAIKENETIPIRIKSKKPLDLLIINGDKVTVRGKQTKEGYVDARAIFNVTRNINIKPSR